MPRSRTPLQPTLTHSFTLSRPPPPADLINVFEVFLPQLLLYPNPTDPLNGEAAAMLMRDPTSYNNKVKGEPRAGAAPPRRAALTWSAACVVS